MNGLIMKSVRDCLWPMVCNEWSDYEECQRSIFRQWCTMNGLMVQSVSLSLWPMAYNEWSDGEECQSLFLANGVQ